MNYKTTICVLFLCIISLSAQEYKIDLKNGKNSLKFENLKIDSIIDGRIEKKYVGYVNLSTPALLSSSLTQYLMSLLSTELSTPKNSGNLFIRINKLVMYDQMEMNSQTTNIEMNLSFIEIQNGKYYEVFQSAVNHMKNTTYALNSIYTGNIMTAFQMSLRQYVERRNSGKLNENNRIEIKLNENPLTGKLTYRIYKMKDFKKGIYDSFYDFRDYSIDTLSNFKLNYQNQNNTDGKATIIGIRDERAKIIWGFSDGKQNYCRLGNNFYPLIDEDSVFSVNNFPREYMVSMYPVFGSFGLLGALAGTLVAEVSNGEAGVGRKNTHEKYSLNFNINKFFPVGETGEFKIKGNIVIISSQFNKADSKLEIYIDGKKKCNLTKANYYKFDFKPDKTEFEISVLYNGEKVSYISHPLLFNSELLLLVIKGNKVFIDKANPYIKRELITSIEKNKFHEVN